MVENNLKQNKEDRQILLAKKSATLIQQIRTYCSIPKEAKKEKPTIDYQSSSK